MRYVGRLAFLLLIAVLAPHCKGGTVLGDTVGDAASSGSADGNDASAGSSGGSSEASTGSTTPGDGDSDGGPDAAPSPNGCGGVCSGVSEPNDHLTSLSELEGTWALCAGTLPVTTEDPKGLPSDTAGIDFVGDTAFLLVNGSGGLVRGQGAQYVWAAALDTDDAGNDPRITLINQSTNSLVGWDVTDIPAVPGCNSNLHLAGAAAGVPPFEADLIGVGH